jgi:hypothetical protein
VDGPNLLLSGTQIPLGSLICADPGFGYEPPGQCCQSLTRGPTLTDGGLIIYGEVVDTDGDFVPDIIDNCPYVQNLGQADIDKDGVGNVCDDCPYTYNPDQSAAVDSGIGNACNCTLPGVVLGPNGCPCCDGGSASSWDGGDVCHLLLTPDGGVVDGG